MTKQSRPLEPSDSGNPPPYPSDDGEPFWGKDVPDDADFATYFTGFFSGVLFCIVVGLVLLVMMGILP